MKKIKILKYKKPELSIILPCYNECKNLNKIFKRLQYINKIYKINIEYVFVDNGSQDNTKQIINKFIFQNNLKNIKLVSIKKNIGYGNGIYKGLLVSKGLYISWTHADLQSDILDCIFALIKIKKFNGKIFVKGKRINRNKFDHFFTKAMSLFIKFFLGYSLNDINGQPKLFHRKFKKLIKNPPKDFSFDLFCMILAKKKNYSFKTINVNFSKRIFGKAKGGGGSLLSKIKLSLKTFLYILKLN
jgi:polyisoprenyl-phosphate glycosyltransferase